MRTEFLGQTWRMVIGAPLDKVATALDALGVQGATLIPAKGFWRGEMEDSTVVEIGGDLWSSERIAGLALGLEQEAIYVSALGRASLIYAK